MNHRDRNFRSAKLERRMRDIESSIARYLEAIDTADRQEPVIAKAGTGRAIIDAIEGDHEMIALLSNEGEIILRCDAMRQVGMLNMLWDAAAFIAFDRAKGSIVARNARATVSFMVQEAVLNEYLDRRGKVVRGTGHWARYLVAWPASTQGYRFMSFDDPSGCICLNFTHVWSN